MNACLENSSLLPLAREEIIDDLDRQRREAHLATCAGCRGLSDAHEALRHATALARTRYAPAPGLAARITATLRNESAGRKPPTVPEQLPVRSWLLFASGWLLAGALACAVAVLVLLGPIAGFGERAVPPLARLALVDPAPIVPFIDNHARALITNHVMDVASSDRHTVKPWFRGRIDFSPPVVDLAERGFPLVGGRLEYVQNRNIAVLVYQRRQHVIDVYEWPDAAGGDSAGAAALTDHAGARGFHAVHGSRDATSFVAVSDLDPTELHAFADAMAALWDRPGQAPAVH